MNNEAACALIFTGMGMFWVGSWAAAIVCYHVTHSEDEAGSVFGLLLAVGWLLMAVGVVGGIAGGR